MLMKKISTLLFVLLAALSASAADFDVEAADIAGFNAVEDGKVVKLTLTNARVNAFNDLTATYYVEDASGATAIKGISLTKGTSLNGYIIGKKGTEDVDYVNDPSQGYEYSLTVSDASLSSFEATATEPVGTSMTIPDACAQASYGKLVTLSDVTITPLGNGMNKQLKDAAGNTMRCRDLFGVLSTDYEWPAKASKITGVVLYYMTGWFLMPISADAIVAYVQPTSVTFDFSDTNTFKVGTAIADKTAWINNEEYVVDNVIIQITGGSAPSRIYTAAAGTVLSMFKEYATLTFKAPDGYAITKLEFTNVNADTQFSFVPSSGAFTGKTWEGNAEGVRMLNEKSPQITKIVATLAAKTTETVALPAIEYTECANIAAFNALENGTYAKVTLTDAELTGLSADGYSTMWIQDATGGCWIQYSTLIDSYLQVNNKVNGFFYVVKRAASGNPQMKEAEDTPKSEFTQTPIGDPAMVEGTLAEVNIAANLNKVVKITGATLKETVTTNSSGIVTANGGTLTQGEASIDVNNGTETANQQLHKISEWVNGQTLDNVTIVAILVAKSATANQLLPISITNTTGINNIKNGKDAFDMENAVIYNLQGQRLNKLQKGVNIVNGKKIVVK